MFFLILTASMGEWLLRKIVKRKYECERIQHKVNGADKSDRPGLGLEPVLCATLKLQLK